MKSAGEAAARWVRPEVRALRPYHVPDAAGLIKLDAMENPWTLPEKLQPAWRETLGAVEVNRYPDPSALELKQALRDALGIPEGAELILGNGSDELIQLLLLAVGGPGRTVLAPEPSFVMYRMSAVATGTRFASVPLGTDFGLDGGAVLAALEREQPACCFFAYPNNPTGNRFDEGVLERILVAAPGVVVIDEAYFAFCGRSFMERLGEFPNLLVMRTLSKSGLAGLRLGFLAGDPAWIGELEKVRLPYNINSLTQAGARFALRHQEVFDRQAVAIVAERERMMDALEAMAGVEPFTSSANFILFRVTGRAEEVFAALRDGGVLIKNLHAAGGPLADCLRVTVGAPGENRRFLALLGEAAG